MTKGIYYIRRIINGKLYIGQSKNYEKRIIAHKSKLRLNKHINRHLQSAWNQYGEDNFIFGLLMECNIDNIDYWEKHFIKTLKTQSNQNGYNIENGGHDNKIMPNETKELIGKANTNEKHGMWREDISSKTIKNLYLLGYTSEQITKKYDCSRRTIDRRLNKVLDKNIRDKIARKRTTNKLKGKPLSEEHKRKLSENHADVSGKNNPMYGKKLPQKQIDKIRYSQSKLQNKTGFYRVSRRNLKKRGKKYPIWRYEYRINNKKKAIDSIDLLKLKQKVLDKGLEWLIIDQEKANNTLKEHGYKC